MRTYSSGLALLVCWVVCPLGVLAQQPPAHTKANTPPGQNSALDKAALEDYVRHLFVWGSQIAVKVGDPKASTLPGFQEITVTASAGNATQQETFYVSKDGRQFVRGTIFDINTNPFQNDLDKLKTDLQPSFGAPGAPVVIVLFSDFQCAYCKEEAKVLRQNITSAYPKEVRVYFKDFPLDAIHPWARAAAIAGRCVFRQNPASFWDYHDWMFEKQAEMTPENLKTKAVEFAQGKNLDTLMLGRCIDSKATEGEINQSIAEARSLRVDSTPTMFLNGRKIPGSVSWPQLRQVIDFELDYQKKHGNAGEACCEVKLPTPFKN